MLKQQQQTIWIMGFFGLLAMAIVAPIGSETDIRNMADFINHLMTVIQAKTALTEGQFPLRVALQEASGWGYPLYQFYSPVAYTFVGFIYQWITPENPLFAMKISVWLSLWIGSYYFYRLTLCLVASRQAAILAAVVYITSPYYIIVVGRLGDLTEALALGIVPVVIYYSLQRFRLPNTQNLLQTSLAWFLLLTVHIVTFVQTSLFVGLWLILISLRNRRHLNHLLQVGSAYALSCLMAMWYFAPVSILSKILVISNTIESSTDFLTYSDLLSYLLFSGAAISKNFISGLQSFHPSLGLPILFGVSLAMYAYRKKTFTHFDRLNIWVQPLLILFILCFLMVWSPFNFWKHAPSIFIIGQYTWRYLGSLIWIGSLLFAVGLKFFFENKLNNVHLALGIMLVVISTSAWYPPIDNNSVSLKEVIAHPHLIYNHNNYLIDYQKHKENVTAIDSLELYPLMSGHSLQLNTPYIVPRALVDLALNAAISLQGKISNETKEQADQLGLMVNNKIISTIAIKAGEVNWDIRLQKIFDKDKLTDKFNLQFVALKDNKKISADTLFPVNDIILKGFINEAETFTVEQVQKTCHRKGAMTECQLKIPANIKLLELPILYYPQLLDIRINGKVATYTSILHKNILITTVKPLVGMNTIQIKFRGIAWANGVSCIAWGLWILLLAQILITMGFKKIKHV